MDKFTRRALLVLSGLALLGFGAYRYALYRYHVTDIPFRGSWEQKELRVTIDFRSDRTAVWVMGDDEPKLFDYFVISAKEYEERHRAEVGIDADLHEFIPGVTHAIKLQSPTDSTWAGMGPDFFYRADSDALYAPPFFGEFRRVGEGSPGGPNMKVAQTVHGREGMEKAGLLRAF